MARRKSKRWPAPKKPKQTILHSREHMAELAAKRRKPDGIYYDDIKSLKRSRPSKE